MIRVTLKKNRDFSLRHRHPWVLSGAIASINGPEPQPGETVLLTSADGTDLALAAWSPASAIRARVWTFDPTETIDTPFFQKRIAAALAAREKLAPLAPGRAARLLNAEADGLPGVTADRYANHLVLQLTTAGAQRHKPAITAAWQASLPCHTIYERSDTSAMAREGLPPVSGPLAGDAPPDLVEITEPSARFLIDIRNGHKTGFYLDQRDNRAILARFAPGADVLNAFSYTGGFGIAAANAGARHVTHIDLSVDALDLARRNAALNNQPDTQHTFTHGNVFELLRTFRDSRRQFDLIILDPPKFADSRGALMKATRGYKDIALLGLKLLRPGGILATFSCSGLVTPDLFWKITAGAALDANRDVRVLHHLSASPDHLASPHFPEGLYLNGLLCSVQ